MDLLTSFVEYLSTQKHKPSKATVKNYKADVSQFIKWFEKDLKKTFDAKQVTPQTVELYKTSTAHSLSQSSLKRHISSLRKFFHFLKIEGVITQEPTAVQIPPQKTQGPDKWHLKDFKNYLYIYNASPLTIKNYIIDIKQFMKWAESVTGVAKEWQVSQKNVFDRLDWQMVEEYKKRLLVEGFSPLSINRKLSSIRKYINWAKEEKLIKEETVTTPKPKPSYPTFQAVPQPARQQVQKQELAEIPTPSEVRVEAEPDSSLPPVRLAKQSMLGLSGLFDLIFIEPIALLIRGTQYLIWKKKGKPVFETQGQTPQKAYVANVKKEFYAPFAVSTSNFPLYKKVLHLAKNGRPNWYKKYHSYPIVHYVHLGVLIIIMSLLGFTIYKNFFEKTQAPVPGQLSTKLSKRTLVFQGRLADSKNNPVTGLTPVTFSIYSSKTDSGSSLLWKEVDSITPNKDGSFSVILGNKTPLYQNMFIDNHTLWLGITVGSDAELVPRQQLANVALSEDSEKLAGLYPITQSKSGTKNVVLALDSSGNLTIGGEASSKFQAIGGEFTLSGNVLSLTTVTGTNSNIVIGPDGLGKIDLQKPLLNSTNNNNVQSATGAVEVDDLFAILATSSGQSAFTINQNDSGPLISASSSGIAKFTVDNFGNTTVAGNLKIGGTNLSATSLTDANFGNSSFEIGAITTTGNFSQTGNTTFSTGSGSAKLNGDVFIGTSSANAITFNGRVAQNSNLIPITTSGANDLGASSFPWSTLYVKNVKPGGSDGQQGWWQRNGGALSPANVSDDLLIGATSTSSAKFAVVGSNGNTSISGTLAVTGNATLSANLAVNGGSLTTTATTFNLVNTTATTLNVGGAATTVSVGATTGTTTINNALTVTGATTLSSTLAVTGATTLSSTLAVTGNTTLTGNLAVNGGSLTTTATTFNLVNSTATTVNFAGAATTVSLGAATGTTTVNNALTATGLITANGGLTVPSGQTTTLASFTSNGGILYTNGSGVVAQVTAGTTTQVLHGGTSPSFSAVSLTADVSGVLPIANGGTNSTSTPTAGAVAYGTGTAFAFNSAGSSSQCLLSGGTGAPTWSDCGGAAASSIFWNQASGVLFPKNSTVDLLVGGQATTSAKFAFINVNSGTPTASIAGNLTFDSAAVIQTTKNQTLTIGGATTGNITLSPLNGSSGRVTFSGYGAGIIHSSTGGVLTSSAVDLASSDVTGVLPIANGGTNATAIGSAGSVPYSSGTAYVFNTAGSTNQCLTSGGTGAPTWQTCGLGSGTNWWNSSAGALYPVNSTLDFLVGGQATTSAKFSVLNINTGTPVASISANSGNLATYLTGDGTLATTNRGNITIGNSSTYNTSGNVLINPNGTGKVGIGTTSPNNELEVLSTTSPQLRVAYDTSNYLTTAVTSAGAATITPTGSSATFTLALASNLANALQITDGSTAYETIDTRTTTTAVEAITWSPATSTIASSATARHVAATLTPGTTSYTGTTELTNTGSSSNIGLKIQQLTLSNNNAAGLTIDEASGIYFEGAPRATNSSAGTTTLTNSYGLRIASASVNGGNGSVTNAYSLSVAAPSGASNNYAAVFTGGNVGIGNTSPASPLDVLGSQPASVGTTPGTAATTLITALGGTGGNTTIATTGVGGIGAALSLTGGVGGTANSAVTADTGGKGGNLTFTTGTGGAAAATAGTKIGGAGGDFLLAGGVGGAASGAGTANTGGAGGNLYFYGGTGGTASGATTNTAGASGNVLLAINSAGTAIGNVGIGTSTIDVGALVDVNGNVHVKTAQGVYNPDVTYLGGNAYRTSDNTQWRADTGAGAATASVLRVGNDVPLIIYYNTGLTADTNFTPVRVITVNTDGKITWGDAEDTNIYRASAAILQTDSTFRAKAFYDGDNTAYFLDPAATGTALNINGNAFVGGYMAIGGAALDADRTLRIARTYTASVGNTARNVDIASNITLATNQNAYMTEIGGGFTTPATGTNPLIAVLRVNGGAITAGGATTTEASTFYITGAMSGATNNYALHVAAGTSRLDNALSVNSGATAVYALDVGSSNLYARGINLAQSGAKTAADYGLYVANTSTSSTASINKYGEYITSTGTWNGTSAVNYGLYVDTPTGGTTNYGAIFAGGNVGIGTTAPSWTTEIKGTQVDLGVTSTGGNTNTVSLRLTGGATDASWAIGTNNNGGVIGGDPDDLWFYNTGAPNAVRMKIKSNGRVGIGTTAPGALLDVNGAANIGGILTMKTTGSLIQSTDNADIIFSDAAGATRNTYFVAPGGTTTTNLIVAKAGNTDATAITLKGTTINLAQGGSNAVVVTGNNMTVLGNIIASGTTSYLGIGGGTGSGVIDTRATVQDSGADVPGWRNAVVFPTTATTAMRTIYVSGSAAAGTYTTTTVEGIHIADFGKATNQTITNNYGINIAAMTKGGTKNYGLYIDAPSGGSSINVSLRAVLTTTIPSGSVNGAVCVDTDSAFYYASNGSCGSSSLRFKENVVNSDYGLSEVLQLRPVAFNFKEGMLTGPGVLRHGLIAEEVQKIMPDLVVYEPDGVTPRGVQYEDLSALYIKAIQQLNERVVGLEDVYVTNTGDLNIQPLGTSELATSTPYVKYKIFDAAGEVINRLGSFAQIAVANLRAGIINSQEIITNSISSTIGQFNNLTISSKFISPLAEVDTLKTNLISPLASSSAIAVKFESDKLSIVNTQSSTPSAVAVFDNAGNATLSGSLTTQKSLIAQSATISGNLNASEASISGTIRANRIVADNIEALEGKVATLSANTIVNNYYATPSATENTPILASKGETLQNFLDASASSSGQLSIVNGQLSADFGRFEQGLVALGPSSLMDTSVAGQLSINTTLVLADNSINVLGADLEIQPLRQGGVNILSGLIHIDADGNLKVGGNAEFAKDVKVSGKLSANIISPLPDQDVVVSLPSSQTHNSSFVINNSSGSAVLAVDQQGNVQASGSATFNKLKLRFAEPALALSEFESVATGSAGIATVSAHLSQVTIKNSLVTDKSLIYLTLVGSSKQVFLLRQAPYDALKGVEGSFTVGVQLPDITDTTFNWLIVN